MAKFDLSNAGPVIEGVAEPPIAAAPVSYIPVETPGTIRIALHGRLRKRFGAEFNLGVTTPAAAVYALTKLIPGFREELELGEYRVRRGKFRSGVDLPVNGLTLRIPPGGEMHLIPVGKGSKGGTGKIVLGVVLVAASLILLQPEVAGAIGIGAVGAGGAVSVGLGTTLIGSLTIGQLALAGGAMILAGILQVISPQPKPNNAQDQSFLIGGLTNTSAQGTVVPVVYGRMRVGSVTVSVGYSADEWYPYNGVQNPGENFAPPLGGTTPGGGQLVSAGNTGTIDQGQGTQDTGSSGSGGKAGGSGGYVAPDTLHSNATVRIIDVLSEGPIGGLVNGAQSIFFNGTPLQSPDGTYNFRGVTWEVRYGYPDQEPVNGFPASETTITVGRQVKALLPVTQTITGTSLTAVRITMEMPALYGRDASSGDVNPVSNLSYYISIRPSGPGWTGTWQVQPTINITRGKSTSAYQRSHRYDLPLENGANTWDIMVTRNTPDSTDIVNLVNDTYFQFLTMIDDHKLIYPNTAYICYTFDARLFGSSLPVRQVDIYGRAIPVPRNYDPGTNNYYASGPGTSGGTWDLVSTWNRPTSNPAFIMLDMLSNKRYGCGIADTYLQTTKAELYQIAQYCDGAVPDGFGGTEARYSVNVVIASQDDAYRVLQLMAGAFRGTTYWGNGQVLAIADMPRTPTKLVNQTNVIDGNFDYQSTSMKTRHNIINVAYLDSNNRFIPNVEPVVDALDVAKRGAFPTDLIAWGCITRSLAHRLGKWALYTENHQTETVTYKGGPYHIDARPGDVIKVSDPAYVGARMAGRLRARTQAGYPTITQLYLDTLFTVTPGVTYSISVVMPDGTIDDLIPIDSFSSALTLDGIDPTPQITVDGAPQTAVDNAGATGVEQDTATSLTDDYTVVHITRPLKALPSQNAEYIITSSQVAPREFAILGVSEDSKATLSVTAVNYEPGKYNYIELGIDFDPGTYSLLPGLLVLPLPAPTNISALDYMTGVGVSQIIRTTVSWTAPLDPRIASFQVMASSANFFKVYDLAWAISFDIDGLPAGGLYTFGVRSVGQDGRTSEWDLTTTPTTVDGKVDPPQPPPGLTASGGTRRIQLTWQAIVGRRDIIQYEVWRGTLPTGGPGAGATLLTVVGGLSYLDADANVLRPSTTFYYWVRGIALATPPVLGQFAGPAGATTTLLLTDDLANAIINTAKFAQSIAPIQLIASLDGIVDLDNITVPIGSMATYTVDKKLYRRVATGTGVYGGNKDWVYAIDLNNVSGTLSDAQLALINVAKLGGQLSAGQIAAINLANLAGQITSTQVADGSISTPKLAAGSVTASTLAAGAVTATTLSVGSATNLLWNPCLEQSGDGWNLGSSGTGVAPLAASGTVKGTALDPTWRLAGLGTGFLQASANLTVLTQNLYAAWDPNYSDTGAPLGNSFPPSTPIEAQALLLPHRCFGQVYIYFYDATGTFISSLGGNRVYVTTIPADGKTEGRYVLSWAHGVSPATCARARLVIVAGDDNNAAIPARSSPPYLFWSKASMGLSVANAATPQPWAPGGMSSISGGMIKADSISAAQIAAGAITSSELAAGSVVAGKLSAGAVTAGTIAANAITAGTLAANAVTAGTIAAGAVSATQIAAGSIHANLLATDFQLTNSAQIGSAVIKTAHIDNLQVGTSNIANSAVTQIYATSANTNDIYLNFATDGSLTCFLYTIRPNSPVVGQYPSLYYIDIDGTTVVVEPGYNVQYDGSGRPFNYVPISISATFLYYAGAGAHTLRIHNPEGYYFTSYITAITIKK